MCYLGQRLDRKRRAAGHNFVQFVWSLKRRTNRHYELIHSILHIIETQLIRITRYKYIEKYCKSDDRCIIICYVIFDSAICEYCTCRLAAQNTELSRFSKSRELYQRRRQKAVNVSGSWGH